MTRRVGASSPRVGATSPRLQVLPAESGTRGALAWQLADEQAEPWPCLSSASVGGGLGAASWVLNVGVVRDYRRTDLEAHAAEVAASAGLRGEGTALLTAADVHRVEASECSGVRAWSTVGVSRPTWPADPEALARAGRRLPPGTINTVVLLPVRLTPSALIQAALVVAEAKAQACVESGLPGTGTASDAVVLACDPAGPVEDFGGPRSTWGARVALSVHTGVAAGLAGWSP
ncbi:adenosylcobinamide amidohydrolase [Nocardioides rotundus]|uniref:adenosylcobinamide amidohydrolase n=1 Tax=Nocardioides rotundus TaxID=1774216 RepID=UPI001CBE5052|nr:adenosylcobinamide amidohydrolase [Nocardioides rotundus]UAL30058.1 adenosylcobinamide amidohydrolase [Nocardioides rotundus]